MDMGSFFQITNINTFNKRNHYSYSTIHPYMKWSNFGYIHQIATITRHKCCTKATKIKSICHC